MKVYIGQIKPKLGDMDYNLKLMAEVVENAIEGGNDIVVFPELALTGTVLKDISYDVATEDIPEILIEKSEKIDIIYGAVELGEDEYCYNVAYYLSEGEISGKHKKVYVDNNCFKSGSNFEVLETRFGKMGILLGDEIYHQGATFALAQKGAKYIISLVNEKAILGESREDIGKNTKIIAKANSLSNSVFTLVVNRAGIEDGVVFAGNSYLVSPMGELVYEGSYLKEEEMTWEVDSDIIRRAKIQHGFSKDENIDLIIKELKNINN